MSPLVRIFIYAVIVADLFALIIFGGRAMLTGSIISENKAETLIVAGAEQATAGAGQAAAAEPAFDYATYTADTAKGEKIAAKCKACHTFNSGGPNRTGPNLFGIVNAPIMHNGSFSYSNAMVTAKSNMENWTEDNLFNYLADPQGTTPGTKMQFNGIKSPKERADLIAWLKTLK